jgi:flagellar biosynthetic protein FlhB
MHDMDMAAILWVLHHLSIKMLIGVCSAMAVIAILDFLYQRFEYLKNLRMSKQDIKDEFKQSEGSPEIKAKLRQMRMERARKRMMAAVPTADVVITNPTHFAVALKYDTAKHAAPHVVAKGQDNVALNIRKLAEENNIPIVQNPPLARALYETTDLDEQVPEEHFKAVAEVIAYVYKLKGKNRL